MLNVYVVPLQANYSEVFPTPAHFKRIVLRLEKNRGESVLLKIQRQSKKFIREAIPGRGADHGECADLL